MGKEKWWSTNALYWEKLGTLNGPKFDIAVDPLEGTKFTANNEPNAFSVIAVANEGNLLTAPDTYMKKLQ